jgi:lambda family phage portal protein
VLNWLKKRCLPESPQRALTPGLNWLRARYDAAVTTHENRRHWSHADGLSADAAGSPEVRRTLRNRARYEIANNSYAKGIVLTLANDVIGTGPRLQVLSGSAEANRHIENEFSRWADAVRLADRLRTLRMSRCSDGESFALLANNPGLDSAVQLDLRLIEADRVTAPDLSTDGLVDGITFDTAGNPTRYCVLTEHPGDDTAAPWLGQFHRYPANSVIHYFRTDRPGQSRGIPDITPALPLFAHLRRYTLAVIAAAEIAALPGGVLYTDAPPNGESTDIEPMDLIELERGMLMTMPGGWKMGQLKAEQPTTTYGEFKREILKEIARCLNMPYNVAAGDSSNHNYASGRLDHQTYFKSIRVEQRQLETTVLDRILAAWLDEAALIPGVLPDGIGPTGSLKHQWFWDGHEHVDPAKEARAQAIRLNSLTTTLADEYAKRGLDWETQLRQRAAEQQLLRELGLSPETQPSSSQDSDATDRIPAATAA